MNRSPLISVICDKAAWHAFDLSVVVRFGHARSWYVDFTERINSSSRVHIEEDLGGLIRHIRHVVVHRARAVRLLPSEADPDEQVLKALVAA